ncbi:hypothetical protein ACM39_17755 [Chryseobacterium sp. FH2]|uniref:hypothetical protein n=1 Tax=Chryseobacterium sp. FH2 TaxID=1674291 RepID=UPI00065AEFF6|nr:hypothetical protein [Chryseobacterium sp. FH2]KMQ61263.1 hypothetical protein ACM39_17755 [Chryseobacterium sp. FH2]
MTRKLFPALLLAGSFTFAQVGVNTDLPRATFEVVGNPMDTSKFDGIIAPKITGDQLNAKTYTAFQTGALVYVTALGTLSGQTADVNEIGYYYFNGDLNKWVKINSGNSTEPWKIQGTNDPATQNTENIYQEGKVAIGTNPTMLASAKQLEVMGDFKTQYESGGNYYGIDTNFNAGAPFNIMYVANNTDLASATESSVLSLSQGMANFQTTGANGSGSIAAFTNTNGGSFGMVANNQDQTVSSSIFGSANSANTSELALGHFKTSGEASTVTIEKSKGVQFSFVNSSNALEGTYVFPRNNGSANQVLVTNGQGGTATLSWKDASSINQKIRTLNTGTVTADDYTILVTGNVSLPVAAATNQGKIYNLVNDTAGNVTINGTFRINGGNFTTYNLNNSDWGRAIVVQSTGSAWVVISRY